MKQAPRSVARQAAKRPPSTERAETATGAPSEADLALFRRQMQGTTPIDDGNRALLEADKPAPTPRPRDREHEEADSYERRSRRDSEASAFARAMEGVQRLPASDRVVLSPSARQRTVGTPKADELTTRLPDDPALAPKALLDWALDGVQPLKPSDRATTDAPPPPPTRLQSERDEQSVLRESIETPLSFEDRMDTGDEAVFLRSGLPRRVLTDLRRGRWVLQRELDLHGMTRDEARTALGEFLAGCLQQGLRCVRLIHGKGHGSPGRVGVLKQLSRGWLAQREEILAFCQARPHEGGSGALLILLQSTAARRRDRHN